MTLKEIREKFVILSGRYDLVEDNEAFVDNGANFFIQSGQRFLDRSLDHPQFYKLLDVVVPAGMQSFTHTFIRSIEEIYIDDPVEGVSFLEKLALDEFLNGPYESTLLKGDKPCYYAVGVLRGTTGAVDVESQTHRKVWLAPAPSQDITLKVRGLFESAPLSTDDSVSWWSVMHPDTLIQSAYYAMERFYRNTQGMQDHLIAIENDLRGIDADVVQEEGVDIDQMENSW